MIDHVHDPRDDVDAALTEAWQAHRRRVLDVAYRMLGTLSDAEDVASETFARLVARGLTGIDDLRGWLVSVTVRLCLDRMRSAEVRRRAYVGPWLPEPIVDRRGDSQDPADRVTLDDTIRMALMVVLERLTPAERSVFVLSDVFDMNFTEIADMVGRTPAACRQLAVRARAHIKSDEPRHLVATRDEARPVAEAFARACASGQLHDLLAVLHPAVSGDFDSAGVIPGAPLSPVSGRNHVAAVLGSAFAGQEADFVVADINGYPGVAVYRGDTLAAVIALETLDGTVIAIYGIGNPEKLTRTRHPT